MSTQWTKPRALGTCGAALLLAALVLGAGAARAEEAGRLSDVRGAVEVGSGEPPRWHAAREGDALAPGDRIRTGLGGRAEVELRTGRVRLYESSLLVLPDAPEARPASERVRLEQGTSLFDVLKRSEGDRFEVETPEVAVMVKGTRFEVALDGRDASVAVWRGLVGVRGLSAALESEVLVRPGFATSGSGERAFELVLNPAADPWDGWAKDAPPPPSPSADARPLPGDPKLALAREAGREAARADLARALAQDASLAHRLADAELEPPRGKRTRPPEVAVPASPEKLIDPITNSEGSGSERVRESLVESTLNGGTGSQGFAVDVVKAGEEDYARISGPGVSETLTESQVEQMLETGSTTALSPALMNQLAATGTDPLQFLQQLRRLF